MIACLLSTSRINSNNSQAELSYYSSISMIIKIKLGLIKVNRKMKNCFVKMIVKNKSRIPHQQTHHSEPAEENSAQRTINYSRNSEEIDSLSSQFKNLISIFDKFTKDITKGNSKCELQPRDRLIIYELPQIKQGSKIDKQDLQIWVTGLCRLVFSSAFQHFSSGNMSYEHAKIYCSESIISNIIRLNQCYNLDAQEVRCIDEHIEEGVSTYLLAKYPMTENQGVNSALESEIREVDNLQALENDIFYHSHDSYGFEFRESGNYNDLIMKLVNDLIRRLDQREIVNEQKREITKYESFYMFMQRSFQAVESRDWMDNIGKEDLYGSKSQHEKKKDEDNYRAKVKGYTSWSIGRKIPENVAQYSDTQIASKHMVIKCPAILRILTKWCDQLWGKFQKKNYFLDRTENVKCQKGGNVNTYFPWMKKIINEVAEQQKMEIQESLQSIFENNYDQQAVHLFRSLKGKHFTHVENIQKAAGVFTINIVNNLHSYILQYLNRLIHGLLRVSKQVYDVQLIGQTRWTSPPNLISFKVGDLMRCKIASQQKEILKIYRYFNELSNSNTSSFKIVRVKNRLREGTNDMLINVHFQNSICEVQLAVNSNHSNFIRCSNQYNHFIYEVKRSIFGPLTELCNIWRSLDGRCKVYEKIANSKKWQISVKSQMKAQKSPCQLLGQTHRMAKFSQPFVCSTCQQTYFHSNYIWPHHRCEVCKVFTQCCKCKISSMEDEELKASLFKGEEALKDKAKIITDDEEIPKFGVCFLIELKHISLHKFVKLTIKGKTGLYLRNQKEEIDLISEINTDNEIVAFKQNYIVFRLPFEQGKKEVKISASETKSDYFVPKMVKNVFRRESEFISLINEEITDTIISKILKGTTGQHQNITFLELPDNRLANVGFICGNFPSLSKLILSNNEITDIEPIGNLENLQTLNVKDNLISVLPLSVCRLKKLQNLIIRNNRISIIPQEISHLATLTRLELNQLGLKALPHSLSTMTSLQYLDLNRNKLGVVPEQIKHLTNLNHLGVGSNDIVSLPEWIGQLSKLKVLESNRNMLEYLPESISKLNCLAQLWLESNCFKELNFKCPEFLSILFLNDNQIQVVREVFLSSCKNLARLEMSRNQIVSLPLTLSFCKNIEKLGLNDNKLVSLPNIFGIFLPSLKVIEINSNSFNKFPKQLESCPQLTEVQISNNPIEDQITDKFLENSSKIERLDLSKTKMSVLPLKFSLLSSLKYLNLSETILPESSLIAFPNIKYIEELVMCKMKLKKAPAFLKQQNYLKTLNLKDNDIDELDEDFFTNLYNLKELNFSNNKITAIPSSIQYCSRIKYINFNSNLVKVFPDCVFHCLKLQKINLNNNLIDNISAELSIPASLVQLHLMGNKIKEIFEPFFKMAKNLIKLDLSRNMLHSVPRLLRKCTKLVSINFEFNPIEVETKEIIAQIQTVSADINDPIEEAPDHLEMSIIGRIIDKGL